jgi:hypothetical protein
VHNKPNADTNTAASRLIALSLSLVSNVDLLRDLATFQPNDSTKPGAVKD